MRDFNDRFFFIIVVVAAIVVVAVSIFFFFFSINASDIVIEYNKNENEENKNEINIIYYNHRLFARLILSMRAMFKK